MKGLYQKKTIVDIIEKNDRECRIQTDYGVISASNADVLPIPDKLYAPYAKELSDIDEFREQVRQKQENIKQRYYAKKDELDHASNKAWHKKQEIIRDLFFASLSQA